jgi:hypothetical protein
MTQDRPFSATEQHIALLATKRKRLEAAQLEAETQLFFSVAREFNAGFLSWAGLAELYDRTLGSYLPGFTKRWRLVLPHPISHIRAMAEKEARGDFDRDIESWSGHFPFQEADRLPPPGTCLTYVLFDEARRPCYVGSTFDFRTRVRAHAKRGVRWSTWQAFRCRDRDHAYEVEERFLQQHKPYLNINSKTGWQRRRSAS